MTSEPGKGERGRWPRRRFLASALSAGLAGFTLAGCTSPSRRSSGPATPNASAVAAASASAEAAGRPGGTLVLAAAGYPSGYDPVAVNAPLTDAFVSLCYNGLLEFRNGSASFPDPGDATVVPDLAAAAPEQPDERSYIFRLRPGIRWQTPAPLNGRLLDANDVVWHMRRALGDAHSALRPAFSVIDMAQAPDTATVVITLKAPFAPFLTSIAGGFARFVLPREVGEAGKLAAQIVGTGPFMFVPETSETGRRAVFKRNPAYFKHGPTATALPYAAEVDWLVLADAAARQQAYQARQANLTWTLTPDEAGRLRASNPYDFTIAESDGISNELFMRADRPPFNDVRVRQALSLALDRAEMLQKLASGHGMVDLPIPIFLHGVAPPLNVLGDAARFYTRDLQAAKQLLAAAGHGDGLQTAFSYSGQYGAAFLQAVQLVQGYLRDAGISVEARSLDYSAYLSTVFRGNFDGLAYAPRNIFPDPDAYLGDLYLAGTSAQLGVQDQHLLDLITRQRQTLDRQARQALLTELQAYLATQQFRPVDVAVGRAFGWQNTVNNYRGSLWPSYANLEAVWLQM